MKSIEDTEVTAMNYYLSKSDVLNIIVGTRGSKGFPIVRIFLIYIYI